jgi:diguanylate cyclase
VEQERKWSRLRRPDQRWLYPTRWVLAAATAATTFLAVAWILVSPHDAGDQGSGAWLVPAAAVAATALAGLAAAVDRRSRHVWLPLAAGIALYSAGRFLRVAAGEPLEDRPGAWWGHLPDLAAYVALGVGLVLLTHRRFGRAPRAVQLDGLLIGLCAGAVMVGLLFDQLAHGPHATFPHLVHPILGLVLLVVIMSGLAVTRFHPDPSTAMAMVGAAGVALGTLAIVDPGGPGSPAAPLLQSVTLIGVLLIGLAPWAPYEDVADDRDLSLTLSSLPGLAAVIALGLVGVGLTGRVPPLAALLAIGAVGVALLRIQLTVRELRAANEAFRQARTDDLTDLLNRRGFAESLDQHLEERGADVAVLEVDLDGFKEVNDSLGHGAGDRLLTIVARRFVRAVPPQATVARLGGDEFAIVVPGDPRLAESTAAALLRTLDDPVSVGGLAIRTGASIGIAHTHGHPLDRVELLRAADVAMYEAKTSHQGWAWYTASRDPHSRERLAMIEDLRTAVDQRRLEMHYQPTIEVTSGRIVGMEALLRWYHPIHGHVPPERFIPLAEQAKLMPSITRAVLDLSTAHLAHLRQLGHELRLSVNISGQDLVDDSLVPYIRAAIDRHRLLPSWITIEITETDLAADTKRAERTLEALRTHGIRISIDDFGVGYSSISRLLHLPVNELKIDRSFLVDLSGDVRAQAVLSATVELGRALGLDVVAEGVETPEVLAAATDRGVGLVQGFLFSQPLPPFAFDHFLDATEARLLVALDEPAGARHPSPPTASRATPGPSPEHRHASFDSPRRPS